MIVLKDLKSEQSANIVMTQKFKNNITRLTGEITVLESDKESDKSLFDIELVDHKFPEIVLGYSL